jgi:hypothetical protein
MTPDDILKIFIEQHRLCSPLDPEADPYVELTMSSTIDDWSNANDLLSWQPLSIFLNDEFDLKATEEEWQNVLTPSYKQTLYDVCNFISNKSSATEIKPIKILGKECLSAAIFLVLKKHLKRRDVDVTELKPSSSVIPYLEKYFSPMLEQTTILAKGGKVFENLTIKRKKTGFLNYINVFDKNRYTFLTGNVHTFRDLTMKIIEANNISKTINN